MVGAFAMAFALPAVGLLYWPSLVIAMGAAALCGLGVYELFLSRLRTGEFERSILITLALSIIMLHVVQYVFTASPRIVDTQYGFDGLTIGAIRITWTRIIGAGAALAAFGFLYLILKHTQFGRAMRAVAQNREAAVWRALPWLRSSSSRR
jgi:branched-chain amino acid transport system permease protein